MFLKLLYRKIETEGAYHRGSWLHTTMVVMVTSLYSGLTVG